MTIISNAFKFQTSSGEVLYPCTMRRKNLKTSPEMFRTSKTGGNILGESEFEVDEETMFHHVLNLGYSVRMANDKGKKNLYSPNENKIIK